jgi:holo-ACP synthase/triphosphoribosyl-dephospho-CoA synthase
MEDREETELFAGCPAAGLEEILADREDRARRQEALLGQYGAPLACLTLNIPGPRKIFPWARRSFCEGLDALKRRLQVQGTAVRHEESAEGPSGYRAFIAAHADGPGLKAAAVYVEETHPLGRLLDIDVLGPEGKIPRASLGAEERKCLICGGNAFACGRSRAHTAEELTAAVIKIMKNFFREKLGDLVSGAALAALMGEAAVTPKPGLVDRANNGAHGDMDFFTFIDSTAAIIPYFRTCALAGFESAASPVELFNSLRPGGKTAELDMREAAGGANTHRGLIFSLGVLSAAFGRLYRQKALPGLDETLQLCALMTARLHEDFSRTPEAAGSAALSHGEALYLRHGVSGIRGEVSRGFPTVRDLAYPGLVELLDQGHSLNDAGVLVLLRLLARTEDTNIIHRSGPEELAALQRQMAAFLAAAPSVEDQLKKAAELDADFIRRGISPGGSADLLAVTLFLHRLCHPSKKNEG